jgi:hypothetical protein
VPTAKNLLKIMRIRQGMHDDGTVNPSVSAKDATRALVQKLAALDENERIEVDVVDGRQPLCIYRRTETGEVLAIVEEESGPP